MWNMVKGILKSWWTGFALFCVSFWMVGDTRHAHGMGTWWGALMGVGSVVMGWSYYRDGHADGYNKGYFNGAQDSAEATVRVMDSGESITVGSVTVNP